MDFISNQDPQIHEMLKSIGVNTIEDLFRDVPADLRIARPTNDDGISEMEGMRLMELLASKNSFPSLDSFLGAGAYQHHVPALVGAVCSKSEFLTSYTPYQAEASQGMLQIIFEFQSAICALTGMDASNASLYDGASACAEAVLLSLRCKKERNKVVVAKTVHPNYQAVVEQYVSSHGTRIDFIPFLSDGRLDMAEAEKLIDDNTAAVLVQYPNFFGVIDDIAAISAKAKSVEALTILCANPLVYGLYADAHALGADIAVGDAQPLGLHLNFGGPYVGYIACTQELIRQLPGRIVGETVDTKGKRGFVLTLQAREQHIRREKATSNVCTNQALASLAVLVTILWYGKEGIPKLALTNYQRAAYLKEHLEAIPYVKTLGKALFFNEFAVSFGVTVEQVQHHFRSQGIEPGVDLGRFFPELAGYLLVAVTEAKSKVQLDAYIRAAKTIGKS